MDIPETTSEETREDARHDAIARRAFARYEQRGATDGDDVGDWLEAEREVLDPEPHIDGRPAEIEADQVR